MKKKELMAMDFPKLIERRHELMAFKREDGIVLGMYCMHELMVRIWLGKNAFLLVKEESGKTSVKEPGAVLFDLVGWENYYNYQHSLYISDETKQVLKDMCIIQRDENISIYNDVQYEIRKIKNRESAEREKERVQKSTSKVEAATKEPKGFEEWLAKKDVMFVLPNFRFKQKEKKAECSYCKGTWVTKHNHGDEGVCPHCKATGKYTKDNIRSVKMVDYSGMYLAKTVNGELMEVVKNCYVKYDKSYRKRTVHFHEGDRRIIPWNPQTDPIYVRYGKGWRESRAIFNKRGSMYQTHSEYCYLYPNNVKRLLKGTEYEKYEVEKFARYIDTETFYFSNYIRICQQYPLSEQVMKAGYRDMIYNMILFNQADLVCKYSKEFLKKEKPKNVSLAKAMGLTKTQFNALRTSKNKANEVAVAAFANKVCPETPLEVIKTYGELLNHRRTYSGYVSGLEFALTQKHMVTVPFINYLNKQGDKERFLKDYRDYMGWLTEMDYPLTKSRIRPKDFRKEHDRIEKEYHKWREAKQKELLKKESAYMGEIKSIVEELFKIPLSNDDYEIVVPSCRDDLVKESEKLHHCVRNYSSRIYAHSCVIVFVRKKSQINAPFYTMEINKNLGITQCRTTSNASYMNDAKMKEVISKYAEDIKERANLVEFKPLVEKLQFKCAA